MILAIAKSFIAMKAAAVKVVKVMIIRKRRSEYYCVIQRSTNK
jgi:hypothetical protein